MDKYEILREVISIESPEAEKILIVREKQGSKVTYEGLIYTLSLSHYNLSEELDTSDGSIQRMLSAIFPNRPKNNAKVDNWLLSKYGLKHCKKCNEVLWFEEFNKNKGLANGINSYCKICHSSTSAETQNARQSMYRCKKLQRTPKWSETEEIAKFYKLCPNGSVVDHIIPLQGVLVSGLHVLSNLQYLTASENSSKCNKFVVA